MYLSFCNIGRRDSVGIIPEGLRQDSGRDAVRVTLPPRRRWPFDIATHGESLRASIELVRIRYVNIVLVNIMCVKIAHKIDPLRLFKWCLRVCYVCIDDFFRLFFRPDLPTGFA